MKNYKFKINGNEYSVDIVDIEDNKAQVAVNGKNYEVEMDMTNVKMPAAPKPAARPVATATVAAAQDPILKRDVLYLLSYWDPLFRDGKNRTLF